MSTISKEELVFIKQAYDFLENQSLLMRIANQIGKPAEFFQNQLPEKYQNKVKTIVDESLKAIVKVAVSSIKSEKKDISFVRGNTKSSKYFHTALATGSGAVGGFFGWFALPVEMPVSTAIIFRSIANTADQYGFDVNDPEIALECMYVFTMGSKSKDNSEMDSSYYTSRLAFSSVINRAAEYIATHSAKEVMNGVNKGTAPGLVRFIAQIAAVFNVRVSEKLLASAVPIIGSVTSASLNAAFADYFCDAARYHFGLKSLEKIHGEKVIKEAYSGVP